MPYYVVTQGIESSSSAVIFINKELLSPDSDLRTSIIDKFRRTEDLGKCVKSKNFEWSYYKDYLLIKFFSKSEDKLGRKVPIDILIEGNYKNGIQKNIFNEIKESLSSKKIQMDEFDFEDLNRELKKERVNKISISLAIIIIIIIIIVTILLLINKNYD